MFGLAVDVWWTPALGGFKLALVAEKIINTLRDDPHVVSVIVESKAPYMDRACVGKARARKARHREQSSRTEEREHEIHPASLCDQALGDLLKAGRRPVDQVRVNELDRGILHGAHHGGHDRRGYAHLL